MSEDYYKIGEYIKHNNENYKHFDLINPNYIKLSWYFNNKEEYVLYFTEPNLTSNQLNEKDRKNEEIKTLDADNKYVTTSISYREGLKSEEKIIQQSNSNPKYIRKQIISGKPDIIESIKIVSNNHIMYTFSDQNEIEKDKIDQRYLHIYATESTLYSIEDIDNYKNKKIKRVLKSKLLSAKDYPELTKYNSLFSKILSYVFPTYIQIVYILFEDNTTHSMIANGSQELKVEIRYSLSSDFVSIEDIRKNIKYQ